MAIDSPPITWYQKHTGELWVYSDRPLPNPSGNTGVMVFIFWFFTNIYFIFFFNFYFKKQNEINAFLDEPEQ